MFTTLAGDIRKREILKMTAIECERICKCSICGGIIYVRNPCHVIAHSDGSSSYVHEKCWKGLKKEINAQSCKDNERLYNKLQLDYNTKEDFMELKIVFDDKTLDVLGKLADRLGCSCVDKSEIVPKATDVRVEESSTEKKEDKKETDVPVSEVAYSFPQLQKAAAELARSGKRDELKDIINSFGVPAITDIPENKYNEFALRIREAGGVI